MEWSHSRIMSTAAEGVACVVDGENGWEVYPFGLDAGSIGTYDTREEAIEAAEAAIGSAACCAGVGDCN